MAVSGFPIPKKRKREPISFLDFPELIGTASHGVFIRPEKIAETFNLYVEQSFSDQLGVYVFVGFEKDGCQFGCRRYLGSREEHGCMVSMLGAEEDEKQRLIAEALEIEIIDVKYVDGKW